MVFGYEGFVGPWAGRRRAVGHVDMMGGCSRHDSGDYMASWVLTGGKGFVKGQGLYGVRSLHSNRYLGTSRDYATHCN